MFSHKLMTLLCISIQWGEAGVTVSNSSNIPIRQVTKLRYRVLKGHLPRGLVMGRPGPVICIK